MSESVEWKRCSTCRTSIGFDQIYYKCSVSTCNSKKLGLFFCSVDCWQAHVPEMRHRDAWAEEHRSPTVAAWHAERAAAEQAAESGAKRRVSTGSPESLGAPRGEGDKVPHEVLVVTSKLKAFIKAQSGMNTSDRVVGVISDHLRELAVRALRHAAADDRKTVLDRDFVAALKDWGL